MSRRTAPYSLTVARHVGAMQVGSTYRVRLNLADFYACIVGQQRRATGAEVMRDLLFTPTRIAGQDAHGIAFVGSGFIDGEKVPGVCWLMVDTQDRRIRAGIGFDPSDTRKPIGEPGMPANQWLGATSDDVRACEVMP